jgi:predicted transcriptional regulator of viral defense system
MAGRPNKAETLVVDYARAKPDPVIDYELDLPALTERALAAGLETFSLEATVRRLAGKNRAHRLQRGRYVIRPTASKSARLWSLDPVAEAVLRRLKTDYFISWHGALWHYGLIDQQSRTLAVAVNRRKRPVEIGASKIHFVLLDEKKFFGYELVDDLEWPAQMATVSRAIIDSFDHPEHVGPNALVVEALRRAWVGKQLDPAALVADALRFDSPTLNRRLGFFMELLGIPGAEPLALHLGRGYAEPLFPGREPRRKLEVDRRWRVYRDPAIITTALELK